MLALKLVSQHLSIVQQALGDRNSSLGLSAFSQVENQRKSALAEIETRRNRRNLVSDEIAGLKRKKEEASDRISRMRRVSDDIEVWMPAQGVYREISPAAILKSFRPGAPISVLNVEERKGPGWSTHQTVPGWPWAALLPPCLKTASRRMVPL